MILLSELEKKIGITFKNEELLKEALTHRSYLNENPSWPLPHNERLEFLGDAVLEIIVTEFLYHRYPEYQEGTLTALRAALVNYLMLSEVAKIINLEEYIFFSRGEAKDTGKARDVILANAMESLIGAIYLDSGYEKAQKFINTFITCHIERVMKEELYKDPKSHLQEIVQEKMKVTPMYKVLGEKGPDHQKEFFVGVFFGNTCAAEGAGTSKQEAERNAAENALGKFEKQDQQDK